MPCAVPSGSTLHVSVWGAGVAGSCSANPATIKMKSAPAVAERIFVARLCLFAAMSFSRREFICGTSMKAYCGRKGEKKAEAGSWEIGSEVNHHGTKAPGWPSWRRGEKRPARPSRGAWWCWDVAEDTYTPLQERGALGPFGSRLKPYCLRVFASICSKSFNILLVFRITTMGM